MKICIWFDKILIVKNTKRENFNYEENGKSQMVGATNINYNHNQILHNSWQTFLWF